MSATVAFRHRSTLGEVTIEPLDADACADLLHRWVTDPKSVYWQMQDATAQDVRGAYQAIADSPHEHAWLGRLDGEPLFLAESYDPAHHEVAGHYAVQDGDVGMHVLVAPTGSPRHGTTSAVMRAVMAFLFSDSACRRVVVEPDTRNHRIAVKNAAAGFTVLGKVVLSTKTANLSVCSREQFEASPLGRSAA